MDEVSFHPRVEQEPREPSHEESSWIPLLQLNETILTIDLTIIMINAIKINEILSFLVLYIWIVKVIVI